MAALPEYISQLTSAAAQGATTGQQAAAATGQGLIGSIASSVLEESSKQLARQAGIEAADAGKQPKYPAFTQSDKEYVAAYEHQAYNSAYVSGANFLQKTFFELSQNPSVESLEQARAAADEYKGAVMGSVSPSVARKLETDLGMLYNSYNAKLASAVEQKSQEQLKKGFNASLKASSDSMLQLATTGDYAGMQRIAAQTKESIDAIGDSIYLTAEEKKEYKKAVDTDMKSSRAIGDLHRLHQINDDAAVQDYLAKLAAAPPSAENEAVQQAAMSYQRSYESARAGQQHVLMLQATQDQVSGMPISQLMAKYPGLNASNQEQIKLNDVRAKASAQESAVQLADANANANSPAFFANMSKKEKTAILSAKTEQMFGAENDSLAYRAAAASTFKTTFDDLNNEASDMVTLADAQQSIEIMQLIDNANRYHKQVFAGLSSEAKAMTQTYSKLKRFGASDVSAFTAAKKIQEISPQQREGFKKVFDEATAGSGDYKLDTIANAKTTVSDALGIKEKYVDPGLIATFRSALAEQINVDGNMPHAVERVASDLGRVYGESTINGKTEYVYRPADREVDGGAREVQSRLYKSLQPVLDTIEQEYKSKDGDFYFEVVQEPGEKRNQTFSPHLGISAGQALAQILPNPKSIKLRKHFRNGDARVVSVGIYADPNSSPDQPADYFVAIQDGDSLMGLTNPETNTNMVFDLMGKSGFDEDAFQAWYAKHANKLDLSPNPDDVEHYYDWRAAYKAGATPDKEGHWPSKYKREGHPRLILDGVNTKTGEAV